MKTKPKLWQTGAEEALHPLAEAYTVGNDHLLDQQLLGYDIKATRAHVTMLRSAGLLTDNECERLLGALDGLYDAWTAGTFTVTRAHEDGHTAIELYLTEELGSVGKKVHTGRSRNDQALVMMRLYLKDNLRRTAGLIEKLAADYAAAGNKAGKTPMPGYTHTQKAMPTTVAVWLGSFGDAFADLLPLVRAALHAIDQNPLGSAAGFGVSLPLDRELTTRQLGFGKTQENPMYCGLSRGLFELLAVQALNPAMVLAGKFAQDMLLFTTQEFNFFSLPGNLTTGSSIMPHKRNYDVFEIMRGRSHTFPAYALQLQTVAGGTGSGYHRDLQLTKEITLKAFETAQSTLEILALAVTNLRINKTVLTSAMTGELQTVTEVNKLVARGVPFREAYLQIKRVL